MKYTENDFKQKCEQLSLKYIGYHSEPHKGNVIEFICDKHENKGIQFSDWSHFKNYTIGCPYCTGRYKTTDEIQQQIDDIGLNIKLLSEYKGNEKPIQCECTSCGNTWTTLPKVLLTNKSSCPKCGRIKANHHEMKPHGDFVLDLKRANPFIEPIGEYAGTHKWIKCRCLMCDKEFNGMSSRMLRNEAGCPYCNLSGGELKMLLTLDSFNINYKRQHSFKDCRNILPLKFDAFDLENNIAFEYNGEQHYFPIKMRSKKYDSEKQFVLTQKRDSIKREYCKNNNIHLIIIPYWEKDNMSIYLKNEFKRRNIYN